MPRGCPSGTNAGSRTRRRESRDRSLERGWATGGGKYPSAGIWQAGAGLSVDDGGYLHGMTGNGAFDPTNAHFGNCFFRLQYTRARARRRRTSAVSAGCRPTRMPPVPVMIRPGSRRRPTRRTTWTRSPAPAARCRCPRAYGSYFSPRPFQTTKLRCHSFQCRVRRSLRDPSAACCARMLCVAIEPVT